MKFILFRCTTDSRIAPDLEKIIQSENDFFLSIKL